MSMKTEQMDSLTEGLPSKSAKIRKLADAGAARADIARFLGIRYQFVHNVLVAYKAKERANTPRGQELADDEGKPAPITLTLGPGGAVVLPDSLKRALGAAQGDSLIALADDGVVQLMTVPVAVQKAQALVRRHVPTGVSLVDDLLTERRDEVSKAGAGE